jgi:hypothetical protein
MLDRETLLENNVAKEGEEPMMLVRFDRVAVE